MTDSVRPIFQVPLVNMAEPKHEPAGDCWRRRRGTSRRRGRETNCRVITPWTIATFSFGVEGNAASKRCSGAPYEVEPNEIATTPSAITRPTAIERATNARTWRDASGERVAYGGKEAWPLFNRFAAVPDEWARVSGSHPHSGLPTNPSRTVLNPEHLRVAQRST